MKSVDEMLARHWKHSLWLIAAMTLLSLMGLSVGYRASMAEQLAVPALFSLLSSATYVSLARYVVGRYPSRLMLSFLLHSTLRMCVAAVTIWMYASYKGWIQVGDKNSLLTFVILFAVFYLVLLGFDALRTLLWRRIIFGYE